MRLPMKPSEPHRIQRQIIDLQLGAGWSAPEAQERLSRELRDQVTPALSAALDAVAGAHELLRLDRLTIDLGTLSGPDWVQHFGARLVDEITRVLSRYEPEATRGSGEAGSPSRELMRQFLFFLAHGRLPWWGQPPQGGFGAVFARAPNALDWDVLRSALVGNRSACIRFIDTFDDEQLAAGTAAWCGVAHAAQAIAVWSSSAASPAAQRVWRRGFWLVVVEWALVGQGREGSSRGPVKALAKAHREAFGGAGPGASLSRPMRHVGAKAASAGRSAGASLPSPWREWSSAVLDGVAVEPDLPGPVADAVARVPAHRAARAQPAHPAADDEAIFLPCAGVVLLHPFLETLFRERGLLDGIEFRDAAARSHAVRLIGLLGFGVPDLPEYELVIGKQLCGHPLDDPLAPGVLEPADVSACDELMAAVLGHWKALRSSSAPWLRSQFLLREGKLESVDGGCRLTVERRAQDVLLAQLPWGFGVIGLSWMQDRIFVRWLD